MKSVHRWQGRLERPLGRDRSVWEWCEASKACTRHTAHRGRLVPGGPEVP